jgi:hypothetical protein
MEKMKIRELMRPIGDFPRISENATLLEAVEALEKADWEYKSGKAPERILLVHGGFNKIVGKLSPMDVVQGLEPNYGSLDNLESIPYGRITRQSIETMKRHYRLWHQPLGELWKKAQRVTIRDFIRMPMADQMVNADDDMDVAFHIFVVRRHGSLFVLEKSMIAGVLLFSDVYREIKEAMRVSLLPPAA